MARGIKVATSAGRGGNATEVAICAARRGRGTPLGAKNDNAGS